MIHFLRKKFGLLAAFAFIVPSLGLAQQPLPTKRTVSAQESFLKKLVIDRTPLPTTGGMRLSYADAVDAIKDSVVLITSHARPKIPPQLRPYSRDPNFYRYFPQYDPSRPAEQNGLGSGFVITPDGYILTNNHVVQGAEELQVSFPSRDRTYRATIIGSDPGTDVALIKVEAQNLPVSTLADSARSRVGDISLAFGSPLGLTETVTMGIVSATGRKGTGVLGRGGYENFIQTDASINGGNSGGPLIDGLGRVIGINTFIVSGNGTSGGNIGLGFAIPINLAIRIAQDLADDGVVDRGFLGVNMESLTLNQARQLGLKEPDGAVVMGVYESTPASRAGFRRGDVILTLDGQVVEDSDQLRIKISSMVPGQKAVFVILRASERLRVDVTIGKLPKVGSAIPSRTSNGQFAVEE